jgi:hypothetical protein
MRGRLPFEAFVCIDKDAAKNGGSIAAVAR